MSAVLKLNGKKLRDLPIEVANEIREIVREADRRLPAEFGVRWTGTITTSIKQFVVTRVERADNTSDRAYAELSARYPVEQGGPQIVESGVATLFVEWEHRTTPPTDDSIMDITGNYFVNRSS